MTTCAPRRCRSSRGGPSRRWPRSAKRCTTRSSRCGSSRDQGAPRRTRQQGPRGVARHRVARRDRANDRAAPQGDRRARHDRRAQARALHRRARRRPHARRGQGARGAHARRGTRARPHPLVRIRGLAERRPLLEAVGNPCAINPDIRLRRYAKRRGWDLRDFRGARATGGGASPRGRARARSGRSSRFSVASSGRSSERSGGYSDADSVGRTGPYFLLRRWWRVLRRSLRCFFFDMRLRRFLMTEPTEPTLFDAGRLADSARPARRARETGP